MNNRSVAPAPHHHGPNVSHELGIELSSTDAKLMSLGTPLAIMIAATLGCVAACATGFDEPRGSGSTSQDADETEGGDTDAEPAPNPNPDPPVTDPALESDVREILEKHCATCHGPGSANGFDNVTDLTALVTSGKIVPGDPDSSTLYQFMETDYMPPASVELRPTDAEVLRVREWIEAGAPSTDQGGPCENEPIGIRGLFEGMDDDLQTIDGDDRQFIRYLSIAAYHNSGVCPEDLERYVHAASKLANSLSVGFEIIAPRRVGPEGVLLRVDLRDYGWNKAVSELQDKWEAVAAVNPYAVRFEGDIALEVRGETQTDFPFQPLDSFLQLSTRAPLYNEFIELPAQLAVLEETLLGLNVESNIANGVAARAGFRDSGVSFSNRLIERHPVVGGRGYWKSFDFAENSGSSNLFSSPIDFIHAGGEHIFPLPNGLHGYMITNAAGQRIDVGPIEVVQDPLQRTKEVINGISCMACHGAPDPESRLAQGIIRSPADEIRQFVELSSDQFPSDELELVFELYRSPEEFNQLQINDQADYQAALTKAGVPLTLPEPIIETSLGFERDLGLKRVAAELFVTQEKLEFNLVRLDPEFHALFLDIPLARETLDALYLATMCTLSPDFEVRAAAEDCAALGL